MGKSYQFFTGILVCVIVLLHSGCKKDEGGSSMPATGLFEGSFNKLSTYPAAEQTILQRRDGTVANQLVYPGQVILLSYAASVTEITELISSNNGTVSVQVPLAGFYVASVDPSKQDAFIKNMLLNTKVADAFPNSVVGIKEVGNTQSGNGNQSKGGTIAYGTLNSTGDKTSFIQTIDIKQDVGCDDHITHMQAVANMASAGGVSTNTNDVSVTLDGGGIAADYIKSMMKTMEVLNSAKEQNLPVVINMSLGGIDTIPGDTYWYYRRFITMFEAVETKNPGLLDNAVLIMACSDINYDETSDLEYLHNEFPNSPVWDHIYMVGSQEGPQGCRMGYAAQGTANYISAPACDIQVPGSSCVGTGNSLGVPQVSNLVALTYQELQKTGTEVKIPEIMAALTGFQKKHNGKLPTVTELVNMFIGGEPEVDYSGTWSGTFLYTARVPQPSGLYKIYNTSFILTVTFEPIAAVPGFSQVMRVSAVTCSDPTFGATMVVTPDPQQSLMMLPATYGSSSDAGAALMVKFPNGSYIFTSNAVAGSFTVDASGTKIESTAAVLNNAFSAGGTVENSTEPGSGPGGYAYNWCTFKSWSLVKLK
jgi:hypothetical protein